MTDSISRIKKIQEPLTPRQIAGIQAAKDPSRFNRLITVRDGDVLYLPNAPMTTKDVATIAELKAIPAANRVDRGLVYVEDDPTPLNRGLFRFDEQASDAEDIPSVVEPDDSSGRWFQISKSTRKHGIDHTDGDDLIDGDHLVVDFVPGTYVRNSGIPEASQDTHLSAHLKGVDTKLFELSSSSSSLVAVTASENIPAFSVVNISPADTGQVADNTDVLRRPGLGIAVSAINIATQGDVMTSGEVENPSWTFTAFGKQCYLGTSGQVVQTPPEGFRQVIGIIISPTKIFLDPDKFHLDVLVEEFVLSDQSNPFLNSTSGAFEAKSNFIFPGTNLVTPKVWRIISSRSGAANGDANYRIFDVTNSLQIALITRLGDGDLSLRIQSTNSLTNLPTGPAIFEIQLQQVSGTGQVRIHYSSFLR